MTDIPESWWKKWAEANELDRAELVKQLALKPFEPQSEIMKYSFYQLLNSYFEDLYRFAKGEK